jgi:hypothetical protein
MKKKKTSTYRVARTAEHLVTAELLRRGFIATPFAGNVPEFDLIVTDDDLRTIPIQVKSKGSKGGCWHSNSKLWMEIDFKRDGRQVIKGKTKILYPNLIYILVEVGENHSEDRFFLMKKGDVQDLHYQKHLEWNLAHGQRRPRNPRATHCGLWTKDILEFENNWQIISDQLSVEIDRDFESRNWMLLGRLGKMGFEPEEVKTIAHAIEDRKITFKEVEKLGRKVLEKIPKSS